MRFTIYLLGREVVTIDLGKQPAETRGEWVSLGGQFELDEQEPWTDRGEYEQEEDKRRAGFV